jgi:hypothetical protein
MRGGGAPLAGGTPLEMLFGLFYGPNITADKQYGIGAWSEAEFRQALREGIGRAGEHLFPLVPFISFTAMSDVDIADLYAYLQSRPPIPPFGRRFLLVFWRTLFFSAGPLPPVAGRTAEWNRGRYLAEAVVHCLECHTPRNLLGRAQAKPRLFRQSRRTGRAEGAQHHCRRRDRHWQVDRRRYRRSS